MAYTDLLLHLDSYPTPTSTAAIDEAVGVAVSLGGKLTALAVEVLIPVGSNLIADYLIGLSAMVDEEEARSRTACHDGLEYFTAVAKKAGVFQGVLSSKVNHRVVGEHVAKRARTHDLCILPLAGGFDGQLEVADSVVFSSGRPVLIFRAGDARGLSSGPDLVVVGWDGSRCAARALADALPILTRARQVRVLTVLNENPRPAARPGKEVLRHLKVHGVAASLHEVDANGRSIAVTLDGYIKQHKPDLFVMGGYGHSRAREFLLGGATEHMLRAPPCSVFLSH